MHSHDWKRINDIQVCIKCGLTRLPNGLVFFDRDVINYEPEGGRIRRKKKRKG